MKKIISKWLVGIFTFALCMCLTTTIAKAGSISSSASRVADNKSFTITVSAGSNESYGSITFSPSIASASVIKQVGPIIVYKVVLDDLDDFYNLEITAPGNNDIPDLKKYVQVYPHEASEQDLRDEWGDGDRGGGDPIPGEEDDDDESGDDGETVGSGVYGDPEDLADILNTDNGVGRVVFDFLKLIAIILTFGAICMLGINIILNKDKAEERASTMAGFKYIIIGVVLLDVVLLIYTMVDGLMGNQEEEVTEFSSTAAIETNWDEM